MASDIRLTIDDIFHAACELAPEERARYLDIACAGNAELRREVEELIRHYETSGTFLERPAIHDEAMRLAREAETADEDPGRTAEAVEGDSAWMLGPYRVTGRLGRGGMGVVYLAEDAARGRQVAIKVLAPALAGDEDRLARFAREARMMEELRRLRHPNIAEIYEEATYDGKPCIVLEYVPGETLAERLARGPVPPGEALRLARQLAGALVTAHGRHIVHRDLKPANIKITPEGELKVLDFGLAKRFYPEPAGEGLVEAQTRSLSLTESGMIIGTPAYMSPEQWNGGETDHRTDLWAFGCILYEMLTGSSPFARRTRAETMKAILESSPEWQALPQGTPIVVQDLLRRCLVREPSLRPAKSAEAAIALEQALSEGRFSPWLLLRSLAWRIDRKAVASIAAIALIALSYGIWRYTPLSGYFAAPRPTVSIEITARDDLAAILRKRFNGSNPDALRAAMRGADGDYFDIAADEDARALRRNQDYRRGIDEVIAALRAKIGSQAPTAQIYAILAQAWLFRYFLTEDEKDKTEAVDAAGRARKLDPDSLEVMTALGEVFNAIGWQREAIELLVAADRKYPDNPDVLAGLARAYDISGRDDDAAGRCYQAAIDARIRRDGRPFWGDYNELGAFHFSRGRYDRASESWKKAMEIENLNPTGYSNLGQALMAEGCMQPAVTALRQSIQLRPTPEAFINLGAALLFSGQYAAAATVLEDAAKRGAVDDPNQMEIWGNLGDAYRLSMRADDAGAAYRRAIELARSHLVRHPGDIDAASQMAEYMAKLSAISGGRAGEDSVALIDEIVGKNGDCMNCLVSGAVVNRLAGRAERTVELARRALDAGYSASLLLDNPDLPGLARLDEFRQRLERRRRAC